MKRNTLKVQTNILRLMGLMLMSAFALSTSADNRSTDELLAEAHAALVERGIEPSRCCAPGTEAEKMQILYELDGLAVVGYPSGGFAVIAKDNRHKALWGYSSSAFSDTTPAPAFLALMKSFNSSLAEEREALGDTHSEPDSGVRAPFKVSEPLAPLIKTQWYQRAPYNNQTPILDGEHCMTGCSATALAQVVNYYGYPTQFHGEGYALVISEDRQYKEKINETLSWDFDKMVNNYDQEEYTDEQALAVSSLMYACGLGIHVVYGLTATAGAIYYKPSFVNYKITAASLKDLDEGDPIIYQAVDHVMIIDGYDENGFLHFNFGWGGRDDGYYDMLDGDFKYHDDNYDGSHLGKAVKYIDKTTTEGNTYYFNPRNHKALFEAPLKVDATHLVERDVVLRKTVNIGGADYDVNYESAELIDYQGTDVRSFTLEEGFTTVPVRLTRDCKEVTEVHLPSTLESVPASSLDAKSITDIYCAALVPPAAEKHALPWPALVIQSIDVTLHVPEEAVEAYRQADEWSRMTRIVPIEDKTGVESVGLTESGCVGMVGGVMTFKADDKPLAVRIVNVAGAVVRTLNLAPWEQTTVDDLPAGVYIIDVNGRTFKMRGGQGF